MDRLARPTNEAFLRTIVPPEEDRRLYTTAPAKGYRWFKSPNVVPIEQWRWRFEIQPLEPKGPSGGDSELNPPAV